MSRNAGTDNIMKIETFVETVGGWESLGLDTIELFLESNGEGLGEDAEEGSGTQGWRIDDDGRRLVSVVQAGGQGET